MIYIINIFYGILFFIAVAVFEAFIFIVVTYFRPQWLLQVSIWMIDALRLSLERKVKGDKS